MEIRHYFWASIWTRAFSGVITRGRHGAYPVCVRGGEFRQLTETTEFENLYSPD